MGPRASATNLMLVFDTRTVHHAPDRPQSTTTALQKRTLKRAPRSHTNGHIAQRPTYRLFGPFADAELSDGICLICRVCRLCRLSKVWYSVRRGVTSRQACRQPMRRSCFVQSVLAYQVRLPEHR